MPCTSTLPRLGLGLAALAAQKDLLFCDVWGVVHNGVRHDPRAVDALLRFRAAGGTVILVTNAPTPEAEVVRRLDSLAVPRAAYDRVATSGDVTVDLIVAAGCPPLFTIGPPDDVAVYREAARHGPRSPRQVAVAEAEMSICIGLDDTGDTPEAYDDVLAELKARDLDLVCANPDIVVEVGDELVHCAGAIAARYAAIGGTVIQAGKPFPAIYARAFALAGAIRGETDKGRAMAIGDAIHTDMAGAAREGIDGLFVTTGIHRAALHPDGRGGALDVAALAALLDEHDVWPAAALPRLRWES